MLEGNTELWRARTRQVAVGSARLAGSVALPPAEVEVLRPPVLDAVFTPVGAGSNGSGIGWFVGDWEECVACSSRASVGPKAGAA